MSMYAKHAFVEELARSRLAPPAPPSPPPIDEESVREAALREHQARACPFMLEIRLKNGDRDMLSYALLNRVRIRQGGAQWTLKFVDCTVIVRGRNLDHLPDMIRYHKLTVLQEGDLIEGELAGIGKPFIESIAVQDINEYGPEEHA